MINQHHHHSDYLYAVAFFVCMIVIALTFVLFIRQGWGMIHFPNIQLPTLS